MKQGSKRINCRIFLSNYQKKIQQTGLISFGSRFNVVDHVMPFGTHIKAMIRILKIIISFCLQNNTILSSDHIFLFKKIFSGQSKTSYSNYFSFLFLKKRRPIILYKFIGSQPDHEIVMIK
jgi:hypothetical protein